MEITANTEFYTTIWTIIALLIFVITYAIRLTSLKDKLEYRITSAELKGMEQEKIICRLTEKVNSADVAFMEIRTKLANIESLLMEIKIQKKE